LHLRSKYYYAVTYGKQGSDNLKTTDVSSFSTAKNSGNDFTFMVQADVHMGSVSL
jgi:hypothetical protein